MNYNYRVTYGLKNKTHEILGVVKDIKLIRRIYVEDNMVIINYLDLNGKTMQEYLYLSDSATRVLFFSMWMEEKIEDEVFVCNAKQ